MAEVSATEAFFIDIRVMDDESWITGSKDPTWSAGNNNVQANKGEPNSKKLQQ